MVISWELCFCLNCPNTSIALIIDENFHPGFINNFNQQRSIFKGTGKLRSILGHTPEDDLNSVGKWKTTSILRAN